MPKHKKDEKTKQEILIEKVESAFVDEYGWRDADVKVEAYGDGYKLIVSQMYEYLPLKFSHLEKLAEIFGTKEFTVNNWSHSGCETCDYGSRYTHEFSLTQQL